MNDYLGGGGYDGVIPTLPAPAATSYEPKNTLDKAALVNALGPALGALAAYLAGGKYGGVAAGSYASALTQQQQIMEQKKQNEAAQKRQAWLDEMTRVQFEQQQKALQEEQKKQQEEIKWKMGLIDKLSPYAADTPGKMMTVEGSPVTGSWLDTYIPGSFDSGMPDMTLGKGLNNIEGYTIPATYGDPTAKAIMGMAGEGAPDSVYDLAANYLLKQGGVTSSGPKRNKAAFEIFSPDNESAQYAMANWDTLKDDDVDSLFFKAQAEEKEIKKGASGTINWQPVIDAIPDGNKYKANVLALVAAGASDEDIQEQVENANDAIPDADAQEKAALDLQLKKLQIQKAQKDLAGGGSSTKKDAYKTNPVFISLLDALDQYKTPAKDGLADIRAHRKQIINAVTLDGYTALEKAAMGYKSLDANNQEVFGTGTRWTKGSGAASPIGLYFKRQGSASTGNGQQQSTVKTIPYKVSQYATANKFGSYSAQDWDAAAKATQTAGGIAAAIKAEIQKINSLPPAQANSYSLGLLNALVERYNYAFNLYAKDKNPHNVAYWSKLYGKSK